MEGEGKALWDRREGLLADRHTCCHRFIFIILEVCVFAGICGGQEMDLNCSLGDGELPDVGAGDQPGSSSSVHSNHRVSSAALVQIFKLDFCVKNE